MTTKEDLEKILRRVRALIDRADHPNTPEAEAASSREIAERLMRKYRIDEEAIIAESPDSIVPQRIDFDLAKIRYDEDTIGTLRNSLWNLVWYSADHCGVKALCRYDYQHAEEGTTLTLKITAIGYESDLRYFEYLSTSARMVWSERINPQPKPELSDAENCYRLRSAGVERWKVARMLWGSDRHDGPAHGKVAKLYKAECERRGERANLSGRQVSAKTFRQAFAASFVSRYADLLRRARDGADSVGGVMVLHGRSERVLEAWYTAFPEYRPSTDLAERVPCPKCAARKDGTKCRDHRARAWTKADEARWQRFNESPAARRGQAAGREAAEAVQINRTERARRLPESEATSIIRELGI